MFALKPIIIRPNVRTQAKKNDSVEPEEIDYEKFNKENKWAIRPGKKKGDKE